MERNSKLIQVQVVALLVTMTLLVQALVEVESTIPTDSTRNQ